LRIYVDTTILLDVLKDEYRAFQEMLYAAIGKDEELSTPSVVYAELIPQFRGNVNFLQQFLRGHKIDVLPLDIESVTIAASAWMEYLKRKKRARCPQCGYELERKEHLLSDFYIAGFALSKGLTRCPGKGSSLTRVLVRVLALTRNPWTIFRCG
jgi:predicted nucleic acid-binding protein